MNQAWEKLVDFTVKNSWNPITDLEGLGPDESTGARSDSGSRKAHGSNIG
jgi:hypothetical protein